MAYKNFYASSLFLKRNKTFTLKASILHLRLCVYIYIHTDTSRCFFVLNMAKYILKKIIKLKTSPFSVLLITFLSYLLLSGRSYISNLHFCLIVFLYNSPETTLLSEPLRKESLTSALPSCDPLPPVRLKAFSAHTSFMCVYIVPSLLPP